MKKHVTIVFPMLVALYEIAAYLSMDMYLPALPQIMQDLQASQYSTELTITLWFIGQAIVYLPLGLVADRYGRRTFLLTGGVIFVIASLVCALATDISVLIIARFLQGATICSVLIAGYGSVHELFSDKEAVIILAWMASITVLAPAFGPVLGSLVLLAADWRFIFWLLSAWATIVLVLLYYWMPESNPLTERKLVNIRSALHNYGVIIKNAHFVINTLVLCCIFAGAILWITASAFLVIAEFAYSEISYGLIQMAVFGSLIVAAQVIRFLITRLSREKIIYIGLTIIFCGCVLMLVAAWLFADFLFGLVLSLMFYMGGLGLIFGPLQRVAIEASSAPMGARMAVFFVALALAAVLGSALTSAFYQGTIISVSAPIAILGGLGCVLKRIIPHNL